MVYRFTGIFALLVVVAAVGQLNTVAAAEELQNWQSIEVGRHGELTVRLRVKRQATLADEKWMAIEFENRGDKQIELENPNYRIDSVRHDLKTGKAYSSGGLASGNPYDLFPQAWKTTPVSPTVVKPGVYRMFDHPSLYSSAILSLPNRDGWLVKAEVFMRVKVKNEDLQFDSAKGHKLEFRWLYPDEAGFDKMRARLKHLLANPRDYVQHAYILHALLENPEVARATSAKELLAAMDRRTHAFSGRNYIVEHLSKNYADDALVAEHFRGRLVTGDKLILDDMIRGSKIWNMTFLQPLIERFERDSSSPWKIFVILNQHGRPQKFDAKLAQQLSTALLSHGWLKELEPGQTREPSAVAGSLKLMGDTHDRKVIPKLMPYLADAAPTHDPRFSSALRLGRLPPLRVSDSALETILTILDGNPEPAYKRAGYEFTNGDLAARVKAVTEVRDKMTVTLKKRLAKLMIDPEK